MQKSIFYVILILAFSLFINITSVLAIPVFPGAKGFGSETPAGRGGKIYKITNLNDSGPGSLRECIEASGPRICVFEVSGNIELKSSLILRNPYITIAGQTAPSPGIAIIKEKFRINTHDVLVQHLRFRLGDQSGAQDTVEINESNNVVFDHCSISWGVDGTLDIVYYSHDLTVSNCIISETLNNSVHPKGQHSRAMILARVNNISIINNLFAHNDERNPVFGKTEQLGAKGVVSNNVIYNWGKFGTRVNEIADRKDVKWASIVGNVYIKGNSWKGNKPIIVYKNTEPRVYLSNNTLDRTLPSDPWDIAELRNDGSSPRVGIPPIWPPNYTAMDINLVEDYVLSNAGARPADRDSVDKRVTNDVVKGSGSIIDSQKDVGGWPALAENKRPLSLPVNPNGDIDSDGYTNLEEWLYGFSAKLEGNKDVAPPTPEYSCSDGIDNDNDGLVDYPIDPGCSSALDDDEYDTPVIDMVSPTIYFEAEKMRLTPPMIIGYDNNAFGGVYISPKDASNSTLPNSEASISFEISESGAYYLWIRMLGLDPQSDALYVGIDNNWDRVYPVSTGSYEWLRVETSHKSNNYTFLLNLGSHNIHLAHGEPNTRADVLFLTNDPNEIPSNEFLSGSKLLPPKNLTIIHSN